MPDPCPSSSLTCRGGARPLPLAMLAAAVLVLPGCGALHWVKTRFVEPEPAAVAAAPPAVRPVAPAAPVASAAPAVTAPAATAPSLAPALPPAAPAPAPVLPPSSPPSPPPASLPPPVSTAPPPPPAAPALAAPVSPPAAAVPTPLAAPVPAWATADLTPGQWAVQVGVFHADTSAAALRRRVSSRLQAQSLAPDDAVRVLQRDGRHHVLVGAFADRAQAESVAGQLRQALGQDVVLFRR